MIFRRFALLFLTVFLASTSSAFAVDEQANQTQSQQTVPQGSFALPTIVTFENQDYKLTGRPLSTDEMKLLMPGVTWVYYLEDGKTQFEYHTFDGYALRWNEGSTVVVAGAWQIIDDRICWTYNAAFCRRIWVTEREDLFALPVGAEQPLMAARFEIGDPLGLSNRKVHWLISQGQSADERRPLNPVEPEFAPKANPNEADRAIDENGAPKTFSLE